MKRTRGILGVIVARFIAYSLGSEVVISIAEDLFSEFVLKLGPDFSDEMLGRLFASTDPHQLALLIGWGLFTTFVYAAGVLLFARSVSRKVSKPARFMAEGFREVSGGNLDVTLDFETETEFRDMRDAFNRMTERLKASEEERATMEGERMQLFSHIAHDLKTPMTTISGYAGALAGGMVEGAEKQREYHLAIQSKSAQMDRLIGQLLSYSKLGASGYQISPRPTDLTELLRAACASLFGDMEAKQMELALSLPEHPVCCAVDPHELGRAVGNLLANAIRHNPAGSLLFARLTEEADSVGILVADNGPPIPDSIADRLFEPFVSGSDSRSSGSGTGLGLAIVKKIVQRHGGGVSLQKATAPYTKAFSLRLPKIMRSPDEDEGAQEK